MPEPTFSSLLHPAPATTTSPALCLSTHSVSAPTNSPGSSESLARQFPPPVLTGAGPAAGRVWECSCQCKLWGCRKCIPTAGEGEIVARGRGRETDFSEPAKVKWIQTPRALQEQCWRRCKSYVLLTAAYIWWVGRGGERSVFNGKKQRRKEGGLTAYKGLWSDR